ncbi:MAG TPA: alpha/beta hydrolase [Rugosibacter sp.]|nr:alpha/beta hydrolase [Rugosibacter sp.]HQN47420.1 alpha/beta hydrolase [Rugosibacter sp.]HQQ35420.1 alpha/beta hydrolase [Rugosibacter sp.]
MKSDQSGFTVINGTPIYFEQAGEGTPIVLLHGLGLSAKMWDAQFSHLAKHYHVTRYDLRGFGQSLPTSPTTFSHVEDLKALLDYLNIAHTHIMGLSLGGRIAIDFALKYPAHVNRLILVDSALGGFRFEEAWYEQINAILQLGQAGNIAMAKCSWLNHPLFIPILQGNVTTRQQFEQIAGDDAGWHWVNPGLEAPLKPSAATRLNSIKAKTLVIVGALDLPDFQQIAAVLAQQIPDVQKVELANTGHMANMENPELFNEIIIKFLASP